MKSGKFVGMQEYKEFLYKEEWIGYTEYLKNIRFEDKLKALSRKYKDKKILIYGNGILFNVICEHYRISDYLDISAVSDLRYEKNETKEYLGFKAVKPAEIKTTDANIVLVTTVNPVEIKNFLIKNDFVKKGTVIEPLIQDFFQEKLKKLNNKISLAAKYLKETKDVLKCIKYFIYLNETEFETKNNYVKVLKNLRKDKDRKIRVAFLCEENPKWGYQSIYDEMKSDANFEVLPIINLPIITYRRQEFLQEKNIEFFRSFGMDSIDGYDYENNVYKSLEEFKPDIVFYQQPWYMIQAQIPHVVSKYALTCIISYGFTSIDTESWGSESIRKNSGNIWHMFAESDYHNKFYSKAAELKHKDILITKGYPKLDNYKLPVNERFEKMWNDTDKAEKRRIIWAPHHSIEKYGFEMSNFKEQYLYFLELAKIHPEYSFVFKPHPSLRYKCITENFLTETEYDNYIDEWNSLENATVYTDGNYFDIFKTSDVLITDSSSFLAEYFYSGKPIIFFESHNRAGFNEFGLKIKKGFYIPEKTEDTEKLLYQLLVEKSDPLKTKREKIIKKEFFYPKKGTIGKNIVEYLKHELKR